MNEGINQDFSLDVNENVCMCECMCVEEIVNGLMNVFQGEEEI
jgi:hypothetical protein